MSLLLEVPRGQALSGPIIRAREVVKVFGENRVLDGISLDVQEHEVVALIGASGSGKSTLLRCLNGLLPIEAGTITVADREVTRDEIDLKRHIDDRSTSEAVVLTRADVHAGNPVDGGLMDPRT